MVGATGEGLDKVAEVATKHGIYGIMWVFNKEFCYGKRQSKKSGEGVRL